MANHKSAKKRARQTIKKTEQNKSRRSEVRSAVKKIRLAITESKKDEALKLLPVVQGLLGRLSKDSITKKNTAGRTTSRLASQISKL